MPEHDQLMAQIGELERSAFVLIDGMARQKRQLRDALALARPFVDKYAAAHSRRRLLAQIDAALAVPVAPERQEEAADA